MSGSLWGFRSAAHGPEIVLSSPLGSALPISTVWKHRPPRDETTSMAHIDLGSGSQFSLSPSFDSASIHENGDCTGQKRALLIGIRTCKSDGYEDLDLARIEVYKMRDLLIEVFCYKESEITILLDDGAHVSPTRLNILAAIAVFVKNVQAGDRLCFHYSGYSIKAPNSNSRSSDEPDDLMAGIVPCDGEQMKILNNELCDILVRPLPAGSHLVAILDASYSGSLLGLKHYRCNRVYVPWVWRGRRDGELIRDGVVRRGARLVSLPVNLVRRLASYLPMRNPIAQNGRQPSNIETIAVSRRTTTTPPRTSSLTRLRPGGKLSVGILRTLSVSSPSSVCAVTKDTQMTADGNWILRDEEDEIRRCESPLGQFTCSGWCRKVEGGLTMLEEGDWGDVKADVISLASCKYSQISWNGGRASMTATLAQLLREKSERSLKDILIQISHEINSGALSRHSKYRRYKAECTSNLMHKLKQLEGRNRTSASLITPYNPRILSHSELLHTTTPPYATSPPLGGSKKSVLLRDACERTHALKQHLSTFNLKPEYDEDITSAFQNPELSSPRPLDMNRLWSM
ncbi:Metacaspase type II [Favolaschia claudopus]|uniref:Metacaspase type II n=1 Tax=Favolaschia claudopus TaxID=2862362 RepID=A0AAW0A0T6_9AGAR